MIAPPRIVRIVNQCLRVSDCSAHASQYLLTITCRFTNLGNGHKDVKYLAQTTHMPSFESLTGRPSFLASIVNALHGEGHKGSSLCSMEIQDVGVMDCEWLLFGQGSSS